MSILILSSLLRHLEKICNPFQLFYNVYEEVHFYPQNKKNSPTISSQYLRHNLINLNLTKLSNMVRDYNNVLILLSNFLIHEFTFQKCTCMFLFFWFFFWALKIVNCKLNIKNLIVKRIYA